MGLTTIKEDYFYDPVPCYDYEVRGSSEYKIADQYTQNHFSSLVYFKQDEYKQAEFTVSSFSQTSKALIYEIAQNFSSSISSLHLQLNDIGQVTKILNLEEIQANFLKSRVGLLEKYSHVPDISVILDNYEASLKEEEKLRKSLFYYGVYRLFFTGIKELVQDIYPQKRITRTRKLDGFILSLALPVIEDILIERVKDTYKVMIEGRIDFDKLDKNIFIDACRFMYGKEITFSDIVFSAKESYELDYNFIFLRGSYKHLFEIRGKLLKRDELSFHSKKFSFV
ncbi:hypothetical protein ETU10_03325 [Apibacter muscae]|uniref:hypothetical protein n=1 Tax=Apibacter muscae TaxID=2509004 RepID=UPI0011ABB44D|nr:hypothetical protein [Apibacter muscae]TWP24289.1 hypothetical protein ETU10_03325 [Apibacter muscae]